MITKKPIEGKALELWNRIIARANEATGGDPVITTIDDLFDHMETVIEYERANSEDLQPLVMFLPTDEALFEIDANTRKIAIPSVFANGIGVQGDEIAEILYFSIDRYFDTVDLYDREIYIQWQNKEGEQVLQPAFQKSLAIKDGCIVFGWPVTSEVTEHAGNIQFAIRFYQRGEDKEGKPILKYSFSTLTATVKVNPGLNFDITDEEDMSAILVDKNQMIFDRIEPSVNAAATPLFILPEIPTEALVGDTIYAQAGFKPTARNKGEISYVWLYTSNEVNAVAVEKEDTPIYEKTVDTSRDSSKVYYQLQEDKYIIYAGDFSDGIDIYERKASLIIDAIGTYQAKAINTTADAKVSEGVSKLYNVLSPELPIIEDLPIEYVMESESSSVSISASTDDKGVLSYQWYRQPLDQSSAVGTIENATNATLSYNDFITAGEDGIYQVKVTNTKNNQTANINSNTCIVTNPASDFTIKLMIGEEELAVNEAAVGTEITAVPIFAEDLTNPKTQKFTYEWFEDGNLNKVLSSTNKYTLAEAGVDYYVKITNKYYGSTVVKQSSDIASKKAAVIE